MDIIEYQGALYKTVEIGNQVWFSNNLRATMYANGDPIPMAEMLEIPGRRRGFLGEPLPGLIKGWKGGEGTRLTSNGYQLYNWHAIMDERGICPKGWRIPSDDDWAELEVSLGMNSADTKTSGRANRGKGIGDILRRKWTDDGLVGFCAEGNSVVINRELRDYYDTRFWSSTSHETHKDEAWIRIINGEFIGRDIHNHDWGLPVRCVKDI